jgi:hypothetical protein
MYQYFEMKYVQQFILLFQYSWCLWSSIKKKINKIYKYIEQAKRSAFCNVFHTAGGLCKAAGQISAETWGQKASLYRDMAVFFLFIYNPCLFVCFGRNWPQWARASSFTRFLDHTRHTTVDGIPLDQWSARRRYLYLTTHNTHDKHPCPRWDSNPQSKQASGRRPTP